MMQPPSAEHESISRQITEEFLDKYKHLEATAKRVFDLDDGDSVMHYLENTGAFSRYAAELDYCREVRNLLQHRPRIADAYIVTPSFQMVKLLDQMIARLENRLSVMQVAVTWSDIYCRTADDGVLEALKVMRDKDYSAVPIVDNRRVTGVFDGVALAGFLADYEGESLIDDSLKFGDIASYLSLDAHDGETYLFVSRNMYADDLEDVFEEQFQRGKYTGVAFVTEHGARGESVLGMVTAWDLLVKID